MLRPDEAMGELTMACGDELPMAREEFESVYQFVRSNAGEILRRKRYARPALRVFDFLDCFKDAPWPKDDAASVDVDVPDYNPNSLESLASDVRDCLEAAAVSLWPEKPGRIPRLKKQGGVRYRLYWECGTATRRAEAAAFSRIAVAGKLWPTEFSAEFMRGARAMASELAVALIDYRGEFRTYGAAAGGDGQEDLLRLIEREGLSRDRDALLVCFDNPDKIREQTDLLEREQGFHVVTTGYSGGTVRQENAPIGRMLGARCVEDERVWQAEHRWDGGRRAALVIDFPRAGSASEYSQRKLSLLRELKNGDCFDVAVLPIDIPPPYSEAVDAAAEAIEGAIRQRGSRVIAALFPRAEAITREAVRIAARLDHDIRVYGERLLSSDLAQLAKVGSPLAALCGVDPYHYGRYAVRAASSRREGTLPSILPVLIGKSEAVAGGIIAADRIPARFAGNDVQLNGREFAWADWMRRRCPGSFGPDLPD